MKLVTLQITTPFGRNIWTVLLLLTTLVGIAEWITRLEFFQAPLTPPKLTSRHYQLGHKLALLEAEVRTNGPIDCIMVGSSIVDVGFDPDSFQDSYRENTGQEIRCFNFGIDASSSASTAALVQILVEDFNPRLLIFGTDARDYAIPSDDRDPAVILNTTWVRYRQGHFSLEGWLTENSYLYRYRKHISRLVHFNFENTLLSETQFNFPIARNGFTQISKVSTNMHEPPDPQDTSFEVTYYTRIFSSYQLFEENLESLQKIMDNNSPETLVIIVEMPVSDGFYYFFGKGEDDYNRFITQVSEIASLNHVLFLRTEPLDFIPDGGWSDYSHLNVTGARVFSHWLGEQVGRLDAAVR